MTTRLPMAPSQDRRTTAGDKERLQQLLLSVDAALEQLVYAHTTAAAGTDAAAPSEDLLTLDRLLAETTVFRNALRDRAFRMMAIK